MSEDRGLKMDDGAPSKAILYNGLALVSKYTPVRTAVKAAGPGTSRPAGAVAVPILKKPDWANIDYCADVVANETRQLSRSRCGVNLFIPQFRKVMKRGDWMWRGMREGGWLNQHLAAKRHTVPERMRAVARRRHGFRQNNKSDVRLVASIPAWDYFNAIKYVDKFFWDDDRNLRNWRRDNQDACVYL